MGEDGIINKNLETDGYFNTGDVGYKKNGKLIIVGREKDIIKKGGFLVNLIEIELVTSKIKGVFEAAAVKVDDDFYGETSVVFFTTQKKLENKEKENIEFKIFKDITSSLAKQSGQRKFFIWKSFQKRGREKLLNSN